MKRAKFVLVGVVCLAGVWLWSGVSRADDAVRGQTAASDKVSDKGPASDVAFNSYVDMSVVAYAWDTLNSELLTDVTLQMLEGERVLRRPHHIITADQLMNTAVRVAVDNRDTASLGRLSQAATASGRSQLTEQIRMSEKLMAASRGDQVTSVASVGTTSTEQFERQQAVLAEIRRAKLSGSGDTLAAIEKDLGSSQALTEQQRKDLTQCLQSAKASMSQADAGSGVDRATLEQLSGVSRQWGMPFPPSGINYPGWGWPQQNVTTWYRNPYDPAANISIPGTNRNFAQYVPGMGWVQGNQYVGLDGLPHGSTTTTDPWGRSSTTAYYKK